MTDADFSSAATPDAGAASPSAPAEDVGAAESHSGGNQFAGGSSKTVDAYKRRVEGKLGLRHRTEYVRFAVEAGILGHV